MRGRRFVTIITPPAQEPVTLDEAKQFIRVDTTDEDALIASLLSAAVQMAEEYLRRSLISRTVRLTADTCGSGLDDWLGDGVYDLPVTALYGDLPRKYDLPKGPVQSITSFKTFDTSNASTTLSGSNYYLDADGSRLVLNETAVYPSNLRPTHTVEIDYVAGYGDTSADVPTPIKTAILMQLAAMYDGRGQCEGSDFAPGARRLLDTYRIRDGLAHG